MIPLRQSQKIFIGIDNGTSGDVFKKAYGIGIYLPSYSYDDTYGHLAWSRDGQWDEFMQWLTAK